MGLRPRCGRSTLHHRRGRNASPTATGKTWRRCDCARGGRATAAMRYSLPLSHVDRLRPTVDPLDPLASSPKRPISPCPLRSHPSPPPPPLVTLAPSAALLPTPPLSPAPRVLMDSHHAPAHPPTHPQIAVTITITFPSLRRPPVHAQAFPTLGPIPTHSGGRDRPAARVAGLHCRGKSLHHRHRGGGEGRAGSSVHQAGADALQ